MRGLAWIRAVMAYWFINHKQQQKKQSIFAYEHLMYLREYFDVAEQIKAAGIHDKLIMHPRLGERTASTPFDRHYFYQDTWAFRHIVHHRPMLHVDIGSRVILVGLLSCVTKVEFVDIRPLEAKLPNLSCKKGSLLELPYDSFSLESVSCLHTAEHIGLGRYGDPIDVVNGTSVGCAELQRVVQPGGLLYLSLPIGDENRIEFNAHRVHTVDRIISYFPELKLLELSGVTDKGEYIENIEPELLGRQWYGCGFFLFTRD